VQERATTHLRTLNAVDSANVPGKEPAQTQERQIREAFSDGWKIEKIEWKNIEVVGFAERTVKTGAWFAQIAVGSGNSDPLDSGNSGTPKDHQKR
jgi:hypothetical protein